jgi:hypothetical protein
MLLGPVLSVEVFVLEIKELLMLLVRSKESLAAKPLPLRGLEALPILAVEQ